MSPAPVTQTSTRIRVVRAPLTSPVGMPTRTVEPSVLGNGLHAVAAEPGQLDVVRRAVRGLPAAASRAFPCARGQRPRFCWASSALSLDRVCDSVTDPSTSDGTEGLEGLAAHTDEVERILVLQPARSGRPAGAGGRPSARIAISVSWASSFPYM